MNKSGWLNRRLHLSARFFREPAKAGSNNNDAELLMQSTATDAGTARWLLFGFTIFLGAYLLFQLEPLIGKFILPWFGGSPAVWTTCMLFFQMLLLAGYAYAHFSLMRFSASAQGLLHLFLLLLALSTLPIAPSVDWKPENSNQPTLSILLLLLGSVGLPFFVLSATSPLLQGWFVRVCPGRSPYPLYALSNLGSFFALLSYPFIFEPYFKLGLQAQGWSLGFAAFVAVCGGLAWDFRRKALHHGIVATPTVIDDELRLSDQVAPALLWFFWLALPAATSVLLLAVTNELCQDVASIPFLWVLPLSCYLLSFIFCFAQHRWYRRHWFLPAAFLSVCGLVVALYQGSRIDLFWQVLIYNGGLFFCCMICHGELFRLRPQPSHLTAYYLAISVGGAIGGVFVALLSPLLFPLYLEFHVGLFLCCLLVLLVILITDRQALSGAIGRPMAATIGGVALAVLAGYLLNQIYHATSAETVVSRNFYGVLRVEDRDNDDPQLARRVLRHGAIDHGFQYLAPEKRRLATAYYRPETGVGLAFNHLPRSHGRRIGVVGVGVGTLLSYGQTDDYFRLYDINPKVIELAEHYFSFIQDSPAARDIVIADARLAMEREQPQRFDLLVIDAFSGDSIPMHLLTAEAMQLYQRHMQPDGVLAIHISNHYLDLKPLIRGWAEREGYQYRFTREQASTDDFGLYRSNWALVTRNPIFLQQTAIEQVSQPEDGTEKRLVWTDDFCNLYSLLK